MLGQKGQGIPTRELGLRCDCIMVWGGDGTLLNSARQVPILEPLFLALIWAGWVF
ncbi:hypothetical protein N752_13760 [Desulforamulus aquiferis]|nr:hypothetical protein N752_13760 [Desulforamulus aquiferis]